MDLSSTLNLVEEPLIKQVGITPLRWWFRFSAPPLPSGEADFLPREKYRHGILTSMALFLQIFIMLVLLLSTGLLAGNYILSLNLLMTIGLLGIAVLCNRRGWLLAAGMCSVGALDASMCTNILLIQPTTVFSLPLLDLLVIPELFAITLLSTSAILVDATFHIVFIIFVLAIMPHDRDLTTLLHSPSVFDAFIRPMIPQIVGGGVTLLWKLHATKASWHYYRAAVIAALEREYEAILAKQVFLRRDP